MTAIMGICNCIQFLAIVAAIQTVLPIATVAGFGIATFLLIKEIKNEDFHRNRKGC